MRLDDPGCTNETHDWDDGFSNGDQFIETCRTCGVRRYGPN